MKEGVRGRVGITDLGRVFVSGCQLYHSYTGIFSEKLAKTEYLRS